ncbi:hypothetical protein RFI_24816, partial [Reticulomyxa filosa]
VSQKSELELLCQQSQAECKDFQLQYIYIYSSRFFFFFFSFLSLSFYLLVVTSHRNKLATTQDLASQSEQSIAKILECVISCQWVNVSKDAKAVDGVETLVKELGRVNACHQQLEKTIEEMTRKWKESNEQFTQLQSSHEQHKEKLDETQLCVTTYQNAFHALQLEIGQCLDLCKSFADGQCVDSAQSQLKSDADQSQQNPLQTILNDAKSLKSAFLQLLDVHKQKDQQLVYIYTYMYILYVSLCKMFFFLVETEISNISKCARLSLLYTFPFELLYMCACTNTLSLLDNTCEGVRPRTRKLDETCRMFAK